MQILAGFADISLWQLALVAGVALFASIVGGVSGYGTGALMPLVLVPLVGAEPVVPIIAISALFTNSSRVTAFLRYADWRRAGIVLVAAVPTCVLGAWGYTHLSGAGAALVIGAMLILSVPLRRLLKYHGVKFGDGGLALGSLGYGVVVGGTAGSGVILLSLLMAAGVEGAGVIATDAAISIVIGIVKTSVFGLSGVLTAQVVAFALLIGIVALPGAFLAKAFVERMPLHVHSAILDAVVLLGGVVMVCGALLALRPLHHRRHRRQDRLDIAAGAQAENGAAVVEQVELDIAAAAHQLLVALGLAPGRREIVRHQLGIDAAEGAADILREGEDRLPVGFQIVVENPADAAHLVAVLEEEIVVAPFLVFVVGRDRGVRVAGRAHGGVEGERVRIGSACGARRAPASDRRRRRTRPCW